MIRLVFYSIVVLSTFISCGKGGSPAPPPPPPTPSSFSFNSLKVNGQFSGFTYYNINLAPVFKITFNAPLNKTSVAGSLVFADKSGAFVNYSTNYENGDSTVIIQPSSQLAYLTKFTLSVNTALKSVSGGTLLSGVDINFTTQIDSSRKFPPISDNALLDLVQQQASGEESIQPLLPSALRLHLEPGRAMCDHDAGGSLVDVLAAVATRTHKSFLQVAFCYA